MRTCLGLERLGLLFCGRLGFEDSCLLKSSGIYHRRVSFSFFYVSFCAALRCSYCLPLFGDITAALWIPLYHNTLACFSFSLRDATGFSGRSPMYQTGRRHGVIFFLHISVLSRFLFCMYIKFLVLYCCAAMWREWSARYHMNDKAHAHNGWLI